jgi:branched-subunit amino acid transport protein
VRFLTLVLAAAAVTWLARVAGTSLLPADRVPATVRRALAYAGPAAMAALAARAVAGGVAVGGPLRLSYLVGIATATVVARWRHDLGLAVVAAIVATGLVRLAGG